MLTSLAVSLALTLILEGLLALLWGVKDRWDWLLLLLVNVVTNPTVVSLHHLLGGLVGSEMCISDSPHCRAGALCGGI